MNDDDFKSQCYNFSMSALNGVKPNNALHMQKTSLIECGFWLIWEKII